MCLAIPMQLRERTGASGVAESDGVRVAVELALCPEAEIGDWLIVHAGYALAIIDAADAAETHRMLAEVLDHPP